MLQLYKRILPIPSATIKHHASFFLQTQGTESTIKQKQKRSAFINKTLSLQTTWSNC